MRRNALKVIVVTLLLAAAGAGGICPGSPWPMPIPPIMHAQMMASCPGTPMPMPIPPVASYRG